MIVTGFMGSPRKKGNTNFLLKTFMDEIEKHGAKTHVIHVPDKTIHPCTGCSLCEKKGFCHFDDDMTNEILPLMRQSDIVIIATPIYFYTAPSELKTLIDRSQALWSRKYKLRLKDPCEHSRLGYMLSVGATKGGDLFDGMRLSMKYFFRGISADFVGELTYNRIEEPGEMKQHPTVRQDIKKAASALTKPFTSREKTILFTCSDNAGLSQMAGAFARNLAEKKLRILTAGTTPADKIPVEIVKAMAEKGLDIDYHKPRFIDDATKHIRPDVIVTIGSGDETCIYTPGAETISWQAPDPSGQPETAVREIRDIIEARVEGFMKQFL